MLVCGANIDRIENRMSVNESNFMDAFLPVRLGAQKPGRGHLSSAVVP